jgi:hypothetical protein
MRNSGWPLSSGGGSVRSDGSFDTVGVAPGRYTLEFFPPGRNVGHLAIDVTDRDINGLEIVGIPRMDVKGRVRVNGPGQETPAHVEFRVIDATDLAPVNSGQGAATKDGALVFRSLAEQRYSVLCSAPFYVESVSADGRELPGGIVDLTHGAPGVIEIVVGHRADRR